MYRLRDRMFDQRLLFWLIGAVSVSGTVVAGTVTGVGSAIAAAIGVLVALATLGWALWRSAPNRQEAKTSLGTGLLVSVVVAGSVGSAQFAIDDRRSRIESERSEAARRAAARESLRITVGLQRSLAGIDLNERDLRAFYLAGKQLEGARFERAFLVDANLERTNLSSAKFHGANLHNASLFEADLRGADLTAANLNGANLNGAKLGGADITGTQLRGTKLQTDLHGLDLRGRDLRGADVGGADLTAAKLNGAKLGRANLRGANLRWADLSAANLNRAKLHRADLRGADLREANLRGALVDSETMWPAGFNADAAGVQTASGS